MTKEKIIAFAKECGYQTAQYQGQFNGYDVYNPIYEEALEDNLVAIGLPLVILVKGNEVRLSTPEEAFAYLDTLPDEE